jgi:uncharacterized protein with ATP-grasp and redox domains
METLYCTTVGTELEQLEKLLDEVSSEEVPTELKTKLSKSLRSLVKLTDPARKWVAYQLLSRAVAKHNRSESYDYLQDIQYKFYAKAGLTTFDLGMLVFYEADAAPVLAERKLKIKELKKLAEKNEKANKPTVRGIRYEDVVEALGGDF